MRSAGEGREGILAGGIVEAPFVVEIPGLLSEPPIGVARVGDEADGLTGYGVPREEAEAGVGAGVGGEGGSRAGEQYAAGGDR
jgi:hypothetical protein